MDELGSLAVVLKFGIKLEENISEYYREVIDREILPESRELFEQFYEDSEKLVKKLNELYRDCCRSDMDMGALEPVSGIVADDYITNTEICKDSKPVEILEKIIEAEKRSSKFYSDIGESVDYLSSKEMVKLSQIKEVRLSSLEEIVTKHLNICI